MEGRWIFPSAGSADPCILGLRSFFKLSLASLASFRAGSFRLVLTDYGRTKLQEASDDDRSGRAAPVAVSVF